MAKIKGNKRLPHERGEHPKVFTMPSRKTSMIWVVGGRRAVRKTSGEPHP